jgi:cellobiose epimerase
MRLLLLLAASMTTLLPTNMSTPAEDSPVDLRQHLAELRRNLDEAVVPFWYPRSLDRTHGGFLLAFDGEGRRTAEAPKMIVTQARMVWLSARLARAGHRPDEMREAARHGFRFLADRMWDGEHGGFYWEVDETGTKVVQPHKHLYGQAFALYGLAEYYRVSKDPEALRLAERLFALLEERAYDRKHGGYVEFFARDWSAPPAGATSYLGAPNDAKRMNTHLHLLEAFTTYYLASPSPLLRERLQELVTIETNAVVRKAVGACTDEHRPDWTPVLTPATARVSYGHDIENIWLVADAMDALGQSNSPLLDLYRTLFAYSRQHGYDEREGGFYDSGTFGAPADRRDKIWWVQAEALVSALTMYRLTGERQYADVFSGTWRWTNTRQTDWTNGEWFEIVAPDGTPRGGKAHRWKAGYHNGRALVEAIRIIEGMPDGV